MAVRIRSQFNGHWSRKSRSAKQNCTNQIRGRSWTDIYEENSVTGARHTFDEALPEDLLSLSFGPDESLSCREGLRKCNLIKCILTKKDTPKSYQCEMELCLPCIVSNHDTLAASCPVPAPTKCTSKLLTHSAKSVIIFLRKGSPPFVVPLPHSHAGPCPQLVPTLLCLSCQPCRQLHSAANIHGHVSKNEGVLASLGATADKTCGSRA